MEEHRFDRGSKWLIKTHGDVVLRVGGVTDIPKWRALASEVVQPRQIPDGLIEVERPSGKSHYLVEIATYPDARVKHQLLDDISLTHNAYHVLPEAIVFVLRPKGNAKVESSIELENGRTRLRAEWHVIELWTLDARALLATGEPALMPWVPLAKFTGEAEPLLRECREVIETKGLARELPNLLALAHVFATLTVGDTALLHRLLEERPMIMESPFVQELVAKTSAKALSRSIVTFLSTRLGEVPNDLRFQLECIADLDQLEQLIREAATCVDLEAFRVAVSASNQR